MQPQIATATPVVRRLSANRQLQLLRLANRLVYEMSNIPRFVQPGPVGDIVVQYRERLRRIREAVMARLVALS